jgi:phage FluMu gp28-like protein
MSKRESLPFLQPLNCIEGRCKYSLGRTTLDQSQSTSGPRQNCKHTTKIFKLGEQIQLTSNLNNQAGTEDDLSLVYLCAPLFYHSVSIQAAQELVPAHVGISRPKYLRYPNKVPVDRSSLAWLRRSKASPSYGAVADSDSLARKVPKPSRNL